MVSFIESASDTDIISYAVTGKAAPVEFDRTLYETALMSMIKENVLSNPEMFVENEDYSLSDFINEIGPLSNISSMDILREEYEEPPKKLDKISQDAADYLKKKEELQKHKMNLRVRRANGTDNNDVAAANNPEAGYSHPAQDNPTQQGSNSSFANSWMKFKNTFGSPSEAWSKIKEFATSGTGKTIGVSALVAAASFIAYKAYKNYFSKAAKACAGKSGAEKAACMAKAKQQAQKARIASLRKANSLARNSSNPSKARAAINAKIASARK